MKIKEKVKNFIGGWAFTVSVLWRNKQELDGVCPGRASSILEEQK